MGPGCLFAAGVSVLTLRHLMDPIDIVVNGAPRQVTRGTTVSVLIAELGLGDRRVAVERNREVVPRAEHARCELQAGDRLELVAFVGGG
jgi:sulfur carrier protein